MLVQGLSRCVAHDDERSVQFILYSRVQSVREGIPQQTREGGVSLHAVAQGVDKVVHGTRDEGTLFRRRAPVDALLDIIVRHPWRGIVVAGGETGAEYGEAQHWGRVAPVDVPRDRVRRLP